MKERPILFSAPMVRAILAGTKSQTRRVIKPHRNDDAFVLIGEDHGWWPYRSDDGESNVLADGCEYRFNSPYGSPGDHLWVKETWAQNENQLSHTHIDTTIVYRADGESRALDNGCEKPWRPSIFMPRRHSRITLEITEVRVERLRDITWDDAAAEGLTSLSKDGGQTYKFGIPDLDGRPGDDDIGWPWALWDIDPRIAYRRVWQMINGPLSWEANPWVWVVSFKRLEQT